MMNITVVGGDNIESIRCNLCKDGHCVLRHISGRKNSHKCLDIPSGTDLVLVLVDFINHRLSDHIKNETRKYGIPAVYSRRAWSSVSSVIASATHI